MKGLSFYLCFGKYAKPMIEINSTAIRLVFMRVSIAIVFLDIEQVFKALTPPSEKTGVGDR